MKKLPTNNSSGSLFRWQILSKSGLAIGALACTAVSADSGKLAPTAPMLDLQDIKNSLEMKIAYRTQIEVLQAELSYLDLALQKQSILKEISHLSSAMLSAEEPEPQADNDDEDLRLEQEQQTAQAIALATQNFKVQGVHYPMENMAQVDTNALPRVLLLITTTQESRYITKEQWFSVDGVQFLLTDIKDDSIFLLDKQGSVWQIFWV